jgi:mRNA-degrading endonuclease toxin of MazEF toxin-antitoxin module
MVDKLSALPRTRIKARIGTVTGAQLGEIGASLKLCLGLI